MGVPGGQRLGYLKKRNLSRFAIIYVSDARGVTGKDELVRQAPAYGMKVSAIQAFGPDDVDVTPQLARIRSTDAQAVVCVVASSVSAIVAKNVRQLGAFGMLKAAIEQAREVTRAAVRDSLERTTKEFTGASEIYTFSETDHNGYLLEGLVMHEVRDHSFTLAK